MRLRILFLLAQGELCVGDIVTALKVPQAKVSQHLSYLQRASLVTVRQKGLWRFYQLATTGGPAHEQLIKAVLASCSAIPEATTDLQSLAELQATGGCCPAAIRESASRGCCK